MKVEKVSQIVGRISRVRLRSLFHFPHRIVVEVVFPFAFAISHGHDVASNFVFHIRTAVVVFEIEIEGLSVDLGQYVGIVVQVVLDRIGVWSLVDDLFCCDFLLD